jgi:hypothetical protein
LASLDRSIKREKRERKEMSLSAVDRIRWGQTCTLQSQKTFSNTLPFRSQSQTEIEHKRYLLGKTAFFQPFGTTENWSD